LNQNTSKVVNLGIPASSLCGFHVQTDKVFKIPQKDKTGTLHAILLGAAGTSRTDHSSTTAA